jgi:hypothetical protein
MILMCGTSKKAKRRKQLQALKASLKFTVS